MKIVCFSSYTSVTNFVIAEAIMAFELQKKGHDVVFITPGNQFPKRSDLLNERILRRKFSLKGYEIDKIISSEDKEEIKSLLKNVSKENFENIVVDDINIGKIAMYEFLLVNKKMSIDFTEDEWGVYLQDLKNTLISFFACKNVFRKENPDRVIMYNTLYSVNHVWKKYADRNGVPVYFLHHGLNFSDMDNTLIIAKNNTTHYIEELNSSWQIFKDKPVSKRMLAYVTDHFLELLKAKHLLVYSTPKSKKNIDIRSFFSINDDQKIVTATMSSYDELFAAEYVGARSVLKDLIFTSQAEWIDALIKYVKERKDLFLLIRVHPREFPNRRDGVKSEHAKMLQKVLKDLPDNVRVNWPSDNVSLYDLASETNVFLNGWSSAGVEMSLLGIPVVIYSKDLVAYPPELNYVAEDRNGYFEKIELALKEGWSFERIKRTYRWMVLYYCRPIVRLRDNVTQAESISRSGSYFANNSFLIMRHIYRLLPRKIGHFFKKIKSTRQLIVDCNAQINRSVEIESVEKMIAKSLDTMIHIKKDVTDRATSDDENRAIRYEVKRLYEALYGHQLSDNGEIKINSLQFNLKKV